jgi:hypothetical protein
MFQVVCQCCGEIFLSKRKPTELRPSKYCSRSCGDAARRKANPEKVREALRKWREANPEKYAEGKRKWRRKNPEKVRESCRKWSRKNPEKAREYCLKWRRKNPEKIREYNFYQLNKAASADAVSHVANEIRKLKGNQDD